MKKLILIVFLSTIAASVNAQNELPKSATDVSPLLIGEKIPDIKLLSVEGESIALKKLFENQKTILIFYRGGWCPYCNIHLSALAEAEKDLLGMGYQIVAISPDAPKSLKDTSEKEKLHYTLLSDSKGELAKAVGIAFQAPENYKPYISKGSEGINTSFLLVPSVFILNKDSEIQFEYVAPNFKERISNTLLIAVAKSLKS